jgi:hypothetical protein
MKISYGLKQMKKENKLSNCFFWHLLLLTVNNVKSMHNILCISTWGGGFRVFTIFWARKGSKCLVIGRTCEIRTFSSVGAGAHSEYGS